MRRIFICILLSAMAFLLVSCGSCEQSQIAATTATVYEFTKLLCDGTNISVTQLITENVSCLHDYTLQTNQMRAFESADAIVISGAGLETFLKESTSKSTTVIDASLGISLICNESEHDHDSSHNHDKDPHIWLSPAKAKEMSQNICDGLSALYPQLKVTFEQNLSELISDLDALEAYGHNQLQLLNSRDIITFHDGFSYMAEAFDLNIVHAIEEESGSEASAAELIEITNIVEDHNISAIFIESNGSTSAAQIISRETGVGIYELDMAMSQRDYFSAMYHNIDTLKEALG